MEINYRTYKIKNNTFYLATIYEPSVFIAELRASSQEELEKMIDKKLRQSLDHANDLQKGLSHLIQERNQNG